MLLVWLWSSDEEEATPRICQTTGKGFQAGATIVGARVTQTLTHRPCDFTKP